MAEVAIGSAPGVGLAFPLDRERAMVWAMRSRIQRLFRGISGLPCGAFAIAKAIAHVFQSQDLDNRLGQVVLTRMRSSMTAKVKWCD